VFSPYYAAARRRGPADPLNHVSINAILYSRRGKRWAMTERGRGAIERTADRIAIGPSQIRLDGGRLVVDIDEWTVPFPRRLRGRIAVDLGPVFDRVHALDAKGLHQWRPIAPLAHATVAFDRPGVAWQGRAYVDMNRGEAPLEAAFQRWNWSRAEAGASTSILYDVEPRAGQRRTISLDYRPDGSIADLPLDPEVPLSSTGWRVARSTRSRDTRPVRVLRTLEDTPFYSRSLLSIDEQGREGRAIHESVDLDRFSARWVQTLLPFRMPRIRR
jgi:carotenoid 1,2-hydratase